jgi:hypothetical protein
MDPSELQLAHQVVGSFLLIRQPTAAAQSIRSNQRNVTHRSVANSLDQSRSGRRVTTLQSSGNLDVFAIRLFTGF